MFVAERGMVGITLNIYAGLHEFEDMAFLLHYLAGGDSVLFADIGANVGSYTILAAKVCASPCLSMEPVPLAFSRLVRNITANEISDRVKVVRAAAGKTTGEILFSVDRDATNQMVGDDYTGDCEVVQVLPLDDVFNERHPGVIKIDVEGFEESVLAGGQATIASADVVFVELDNPAITKAMEDFGFSRYSYDPFKRELHPVSRKQGNNNLWLKNAERALARCSKSRLFTICGATF